MLKVKTNLFLYLLCASIFSQTAFAKQNSMNAVDIINISTLEQSAISPNAKQMAFIKGEANWKLNKTMQDIWLVDIGSGKPRQLTFDGNAKSRIQWSPNGESISFVSQRSGISTSAGFKGIHLLSINGGEAREVTSHRADIRAYHWAPNGDSIYFLAAELLDKELADAKAKKDDMFPFEEALSYTHIWHLDLAKKFTRQISHGEFHVLDFTLSRDGETLAYNRAPGDLPDDWHQSEIWSSDKYGGSIQRLTNNNYAERNIEFSPNDKNLLFISDIDKNGSYFFDANLFILSLESRKAYILADELDLEVEAAHWNKNGKEIFIQANMGVHSELWRIPISEGKPSQLTEGRHTIKKWRYNIKSNRHAFVIVSSDNPGEFATLSPNSQKILKLTKFHSKFKKQFKLPKQKLISWRAEDGTKIEGLLSYPLKYTDNRRYPLIVHAHGGPGSSDQWGQYKWDTYIPLASAEGYFYLTVNYRGSRGYGDKFMRDMAGHYFNNAHLDIMSGIDHLIKEGMVDPKQLIISGWSAGGHMTNKLITFTNRFKAASSGAGAIEWMSMYGESDERQDRLHWFGTSPWQENANIQQFLKDSPLSELWKVTTPTIIFVGENDARVPPSQSKLLYRALRDLGIESKLYIAPREAHSFQELRHRLFKINAELAWFNKYLEKTPYKKQLAPE